MKYILEIFIASIMVAGGLNLLGWHISEFTISTYVQSLIGVWFIMSANTTAGGLTKWFTK